MDGLEDTVGVPRQMVQSSDFAVRRLDDRLHCPMLLRAEQLGAGDFLPVPTATVLPPRRPGRHRSQQREEKELRSEGDGENRGDGQGHEHRDPRKGGRAHRFGRPWLRHRDHGRRVGWARTNWQQSSPVGDLDRRRRRPSSNSRTKLNHAVAQLDSIINSNAGRVGARIVADRGSVRRAQVDQFEMAGLDADPGVSPAQRVVVEG